MSKRGVLFLLFLTPLFLFAQLDTPQVLLKVMNCKTRADVYGATFRMVGQDGSNYSVQSDSSGEFHFNFPFTTNYLINCEAPPHPVLPPGECWDFSVKYFNAQQTVFLDTAKLEAGKKYREEFCVMPIINDHYRTNLPKACFKENDTLFSETHCYNWEPDSMFRCIAELLEKKPDIRLKVAVKSHWGEKNAQQLSDQRLAMVRRLLLVQGVEEKRLYLKSYGLEEPQLNKELFYDVFRTEEDQIMGALQNRLVYFWLVDKEGKEIR